MLVTKDQEKLRQRLRVIKELTVGHKILQEEEGSSANLFNWCRRKFRTTGELGKLIPCRAASFLIRGGFMAVDYLLSMLLFDLKLTVTKSVVLLKQGGGGG